jgi:hypothetical protein
MSYIAKILSIMIIVLITVSSFLTVTSNAQTTSTPSVPQFKLSLQGWTNNYYVQVEIKNQQFYSNGTNQLYYHLRLKDHKSGDNKWFISGYLEQSILSDTTGLLIPSFKTPHNDLIAPTGTQVDFQTEAIYGNASGIANGQWCNSVIGQSSGWSPTQTIYIPANVPSTISSNPTQPPPTQTPLTTPIVLEKEPQQTRISMQYIGNQSDSESHGLPGCYMNLTKTDPHSVNLTITVSTAALLYQTENFQTWLSTDANEPQKLSGVLDSYGSAIGQLYSRQYNVTLNGLEDGSHTLRIRVSGDYYGVSEASYDCEGKVTVAINDQTNLLPTEIFSALTFVIVTAVLAMVTIAVGIAVYRRRRRTSKQSAAL